MNTATTKSANSRSERTATVLLFRSSGKYYTKESWRVPDKNSFSPSSLQDSPDFRRIDGGVVLVCSEAELEGDENWGFPHVL